jgi:hypothetical protein
MANAVALMAAATVKGHEQSCFAAVVSACVTLLHWCVHVELAVGPQVCLDVRSRCDRLRALGALDQLPLHWCETLPRMKRDEDRKGKDHKVGKRRQKKSGQHSHRWPRNGAVVVLPVLHARHKLAEGAGKGQKVQLAAIGDCAVVPEREQIKCVGVHVFLQLLQDDAAPFPQQRRVENLDLKAKKMRWEWACAGVPCVPIMNAKCDVSRAKNSAMVLPPFVLLFGNVLAASAHTRPKSHCVPSSAGLLILPACGP